MNKTALITGANKGIGLGISKYLGLSGWDIIIGARNEARALETMNKLKDAGCTVLGWVKIELCDLDGISLAAKEINEKYPSLNLLVNNAGIPGDMSKTSWETDMKDIKETADVNYFGTLAVTQALLPLIKANKGRIVNSPFLVKSVRIGILWLTWQARLPRMP